MMSTENTLFIGGNVPKQARVNLQKPYKSAKIEYYET